MALLNGKYYESDYEEAFVDLLRQSGWDYTFGENLHRKVTDALIEEDLMNFLKAEYAKKDLSPEELDIIVANLRNVGGATDYLALRSTFTLYRDGYSFVYGDGRALPFTLNYINFDHPERNIFRCVNQYEMLQGQQTRIPDVMLFVNGIPVAIIELKNPTDENADIRAAHTQITVRYRRDISSLMKYCALAVISDGSNTRLGNTFAAYEFFYAWKKVNNEDKAGKGVAELESLIQGALKPERLLEILRDYVYFPDESEFEKETEIVCRYPQFFAARKLRDNILKHLISAGGDGKGGVYFGATGCGKTYTMLFLARQLSLRCKAQLGSPTILLIVDREDLETQAGKLFCVSKDYLADSAVEIFESRKHLSDELKSRKTGGFYITTIQKFCENMGELSDRSNIICFSDEAHRSQVSLGSTLKIVTGDKAKDGEQAVAQNDGQKMGAFISYGFAQYLRTALPKATYVGFTGTPIDETIHVFGQIVDQYTMRESKEDKITVPIKYVPRLARVALSKEEADKIEAYYRQCEAEGAKLEDVDKSKEAMSSLEVILGDEKRLARVANDIINDYEARLADQPDLLQKAMITCSNREIAYRLYLSIKALRPEWCEPRQALDESTLTPEQKKKLEAIPYINLVATRSANDPKDMWNLLGDDDYRKNLDTQFKKEESNFHIAIVVDMWITGFDCPALTYLYNDKPLQKHTLIQTISRVNRVYKTKECGVIIDYIGIRENMLSAMKKYGGDDVEPKDDVEAAHSVLINKLEILKEMLRDLDFSPFFGTDPLQRLMFLQTAAEFILANSVKEKGKVSFEAKFKGEVRLLRAAYNICNPAGVLTEAEIAWSQCFMGILSFVSKITATHHDVESMNKIVEQMVKEALKFSGVEAILDVQDEEDIFGDGFMKELDDVKMPNTKFQLLVKMLRKAIRDYARTNKVRADHFERLLQQTIDDYNNRDKLTFTNDVATSTINAVTEVVTDKVKTLTDRLIDLFKGINKDKEEFRKLGITFEEKAFFDILVDIRDREKFEYPEDRCIELSKKIKELVDSSSLYADWMNNDRIRGELSSKVALLLYKEGYPPTWDEEVFERVLGQVENYKKYN